MRLFFALALVCALGLGALYLQTDGFTVATTEAARRAAVARRPLKIPDTQLLFASGRRDSLLHDLQADGRVTLIDFIYTRCLSICLAMGSEFQQLQQAIGREGRAGRIRLLSISFDPADTPERLARYADSQHADPGIWQFAGMPAAIERRALLDAFGVVVVPAELGQFVHNAAYHVVTADGHLARIVDYGEPRAALRVALALAEAPLRGVPGRVAQARP